MNSGEIEQLQDQPTMLDVKQNFQIEYSVFFNYRTTSKSYDSQALMREKKIEGEDRRRLLAYLKEKRRKKSGGSWLSSSSSTASLFLFSYTCDSPLVLLISLAGRILEEHFISKLHFSWPQMSCASQSPVRGSRVVLASYKDSGRQIQKFAMRFVTSLEAQSFIDSLKESLKAVETIQASTGNVLPGQLETELIQTDDVQHCVAEEMNPIYPASEDAPLVQASVSDGARIAEETLLRANKRSTDGNLPSGLTALLNDSCNEAEEGILNVPLEADIFSHLVKNSSGSTFYAVLGKLERFIRDVGGDMTLRLS